MKTNANNALVCIVRHRESWKERETRRAVARSLAGTPRSVASFDPLGDRSNVTGSFLTDADESNISVSASDMVSNATGFTGTCAAGVRR